MPTDRITELLGDVAAQLEAMEQPLNMAWMERRAVSLEEVESTSQTAALILRGYLALTPADRLRFVQDGVFLRFIPGNKPAETVLGQRLDSLTK